MNRRTMLGVAAALLVSSGVHGQAASTTYVVTYLEVKPESTSAGAALAVQFTRSTRAAAGVLGVDAFQELDRPNRLVVIETWKDPAAFGEHEKSVDTVAFRDKLRAIQRSPYDQRVNTGFAVDPALGKSAAGTVYVVTHVDVPGARREEAEGLLRKLAAASRGEPGHVRYDVYQQLDPRTNHFSVFAAWNDRRAFDAYGGTVGALQFREALAPMLGALYDERLYRLISPR